MFQRASRRADSSGFERAKMGRGRRTNPPAQGRLLALRVQQGRRDSNPRPTVLETAALPTELRPWAHGIVARLILASLLRVRQRPAMGALFSLLALGLRGRSVCGRTRSGGRGGTAGSSRLRLPRLRSGWPRSLSALSGKPKHRVSSAGGRGRRHQVALAAVQHEQRRQSASGPPDPHLRAARQVRGRPPRVRAARARRRG